MTTDNQSPLILVDGSSYLFRAFHGLPPLTNSKGMATGAVYGVINMLRSLLKDYQSKHVAVIFDAKGKTFRDDIYGEYKANRPPMPDELREQIQPLHEIIRAMGFPIIVESGVEADDVIGTLSRIASEQQRRTIISTGDKDMAQLVNDHVSLVNTMTNTTMDRQGVIDKFGIPPELIIDYLALKGDKVDNIPGVPGVGDKTALGMLQGLGNIDNIYQNLDKIAGLGFRGSKTMAVKMRDNEEQARLSYLLATIKLDVQLDFSIDSLTMSEADIATLQTHFEELEFKRWAGDIETFISGNTASANQRPQSEATNQSKDDKVQHISTTQPAMDTDYQTILTEDELNTWLDKLKKADLFAFDTETTSVNYIEAELVGFSFAVKAGEAAYLPFGHDYPDAPEQLTKAQVLAAFKPILEDESIKKVGQHLKYDKNVLANEQITLRGIAYDTMLESYVFNSNAGRHDMDSIAQRILEIKTIHFEDIAGKGAKQLTFNQIALEQAAPYAAEDADITLRLHQALWPKLQKSDQLAQLLTNIEVPLASVLADMEQTGVLIDAQQLKLQSNQLAEQIIAIEKSVHELAGESFNLGSTKQLQHILYEKLGLPVLKKTPKGAPSTAEEVLLDLAQDYELPKLLINYRGLTKLKNTYTDKLPKMVSHRTGRLHTSYHQAVTATGRLSSTDPNLQNIPIKTDEGRRVRKAFVAPTGFKIVAADYSQIELRIMAHLSGDKGLLHAFAEGKDIHKATAAEVFAVDLDQVTTEQRRSAKAINFGLIYGMSAFGLAKQLHIGRNEAQKYMDLYFERYPGVLTYMETTREQAKAQGYVETVFGRRLYLPEINARNATRRKAAERAAINAPMQGTAADIIKQAMLSVHNWLQQINKQDIRMIMQVHDELVFEVAQDKVADYTAKINQLMEQAVSLDVPLLVEAGIGDTWDEAH